MPVDQLYEVCWERSSPYVMARLRGNGGALVTQASLSAITCRVWEMLAADAVATEVTPAPTVTISTSVFDTPQTPTLDPRWTRDQTGYTFGFAVPAANLPAGNREYVVQFTFTPATGDAFYLSVQFSTSRIFAYPA